MSSPDWTAPTALYRHFNADGVLLYVGIATHHVARLQQHAKDAHWSKDIRRVTVEMLPDRWAALSAEEAAIKKEKPRHNVVHNQKYRPRRPVPIKAQNKKKTVFVTEWTAQRLTDQLWGPMPGSVTWEKYGLSMWMFSDEDQDKLIESCRYAGRPIPEKEPTRYFAKAAA